MNSQTDFASHELLIRSLTPANTAERLAWVDTAKALGIFLVYYGHVVQRFYEAGSPGAYAQFKFIYAFHIPLFFFVAGFFWKGQAADLWRKLKLLLLRRLLPVGSFALMFLPLWIVYYEYTDKQATTHEIASRLAQYLSGFPALDGLTWFLVCLFSCEVFAAIALPHVSRLVWRLLFGSTTLVAGLLICQNMGQIQHLYGIPPNFWYAQEAIVALGFYVLGLSIFPAIHDFRRVALGYKLVAALAGAMILFYSNRLNSPTPNFVVYMVISAHGEITPFITGALAGIVLTVAVSEAIPGNPTLAFMGQNSLILFGLDGIFHYFINRPLIQALPPLSMAEMTLASLSITLVSITLSVPLVFLVSRFLPQLFGRTSQKGPLLPALE